MIANFDPVYLEDRYRTALISMLETKEAVIPPRAVPAVLSRRNVINLMEVLQRSLAAEQLSPGKPVEKSRRAVAASGTDARRSKEPTAPSARRPSSGRAARRSWMRWYLTMRWS
jgi:hypothetical protein